MRPIPFASNSEVVIATLAPAMHGFNHIFSSMDAAGERQVGVDVSVENGNPAQGQA